MTLKIIRRLKNYSLKNILFIKCLVKNIFSIKTKIQKYTVIENKNI